MIKKSQMKCNAPKRAPSCPIVPTGTACAGGEERIIRFGQQETEQSIQSPTCLQYRQGQNVRRLLGQRNQVEVNL